MKVVFTSYVSNYLNNNTRRIGCYLSSGLDSRMNAWVLNKLKQPFLGITYDCGSEEDTLSSLQYGALTGNPIINGFMSRPDNIQPYLNMAASCFGFTQPAENCQFFPLASHLNHNIDLILDGTSGDIFFGGLLNNRQHYSKKFWAIKFLK